MRPLNMSYSAMAHANQVTRCLIGSHAVIDIDPGCILRKFTLVVDQHNRKVLVVHFFFSSRRRHTRSLCDWSSDVCSSDLRGREPIALTPKAFEVLLLLIQHSGEVVNKDELMQTMWPDSFVEESNLTQTVFMLRKALGETSKQRYVLTVQGRGYRFAPEVKSIPANGDSWDTSSTSVIHRDDSPTVNGQRDRARRTRKHAVLAFSFLVLFAIGLTVWLLPALSRRANASPPIHSIAVLPLDNLSGDPAQDYFAAAMTDELITNLAKVDSLRVTSRTTIALYKRTSKRLPEIARELNVDGIVEGSVVRSGERIRVTAQLIRASTDQHLWAETYDR